MKKLIVLFLVLAGCRTTAATTTTTTGPSPVLSGNQTGAPDAISAIRGFLAAAKQQDLQAMSALWGTKEGAVREQMDRVELEKREFIMVCYLKHDRYEIVGDAPNPGGARAAVVSLTLGELTRSTTFDVVQGPSSRWYVQNVDMKTLQDFCARRGSQSGA